MRAKSFKATLRVILFSVFFSVLPSYSAHAAINDFVDFTSADSIFDQRINYGITYSDSLVFASWDRLRSGTAPWSGTLSLFFDANVDFNPYTFNASLISPRGTEIPLAGTTDVSKKDYSISCYTLLCRSYYAHFPVNLPIGAESGSYALKITVHWTHSVCQGTVCESDVPASRSIVSKDALIISSSPTPTAPQANSNIPKSKFDFTQASSGSLICIQPQFTDSDLSQYSITGTHWKIMDQSGTVIDDYDWPLTLATNLSASADKSLGGQRTTLLVDGNWYYFYQLSLPKEGMTYSCSVSVVTSSGTGIPVTEYVTALLTSTPTQTQIPTVVAKKKTTITCVKSKLTKKVTALKPVCPKGYKKK